MRQLEGRNKLPVQTSPARSLPIELMPFDGDTRNWPLFCASFKSTVHENASLTDANRLYYLLGKLSPKAQSVFAGITHCAENYQLIFQTLMDRYQDTRVLASLIKL